MAKQLGHKPDHFQQQAIDSTARGIRIVAPAGSGKSETLARRIAKRVQQDGIDPRRILVLTFDNAAKKSLSGFFSGLIDRNQMPQIRTFNSHGNQILRKYFPNEKAELPNTGGSQDVTDLKRKYNGLGYDYPVLSWDGISRTMIETFSSLKNQGFYPGRSGERERQTNWLRDEYLRLPREGETSSLEEYWGMPSSAPSEESYSIQLSGILDLFEQFETGMRGLGRMDYEDQKSRAVEQLRRSRVTCKKLQAEFDEIVVDECQDISRLDAMLVLAGDDDQTLYEWRNAHSLYLRHPEIVFKGLEFETIHLNLNYRSPQAILGPAVKLISHNVERIEKSPSSGVPQAGDIDVRAIGSHRLLDQALVEDIKSELEAGRPAEDIAVLCHARQDRAMKIPLEARLRDAGIPIVKATSDEQVTEPGVWVRSFLKSKGRQWPLVYIPAVNDRDVPDTESIRKDEVESIRRRFYVAMTRASERLVMTYVRGGDVDRIDTTAEGDVIGTNGASRFLFEAGLVHSQEESTNPREAAEVPVEDSAAEPAQDREIVLTEVAKSAVKSENPAEPTKPVPAKKRGKLKNWEPRATDTRRIEKALNEWESGDHDDAIRNAWKPVESAMKRMVKSPTLGRAPSMKDVIDEAVVIRVIDMSWKDRLQMWRRVRNHAEHDLFALGEQTMSIESYRDHGFELVHGASEFFVHLEDRHAPKQLALETQDDFLHRLSNLVTQIQQGKASPITGRPLRALRFHPEQNQFDVLAMQLLMVLRDVRFYIPEEFRWSSSPIISKFSVDAAGFLPTGFRTARSNRLRLNAGEQMNQLFSRFDRIVHQESEDENPGRFLIERLNDGIKLENGNFHSGLKLNPKAKV